MEDFSSVLRTWSEWEKMASRMDVFKEKTFRRRPSQGEVCSLQEANNVNEMTQGSLVRAVSSKG